MTYSWFLLLQKHSISLDDVRYALTKDAIRFVYIITPIISKAAMQTYFSALPVVPSDSLLFQKYSMIQPSVKSSGPASGRSICRIIYNPRVIRSNTGRIVYDGTSSYDVIPLDLSKNGADEEDFDLFAISPDGKWIATWYTNVQEPFLKIWNVETRSYARTIAKGFVRTNTFNIITYSADGKKIMFIIGTSYDSELYKYAIWDITTHSLVKQLEVSQDDEVAISPDGSKIAVANGNGIQIIDVSTGNNIGKLTIIADETCYTSNRFIWSPNGQFLACVMYDRPFTKAEIYVVSSGGSLKLRNPCVGFRKFILALACSPNSSKVAAVHADKGHEMVLSISCTLTGNLIRTTSFTLASRNIRIAFTSDENILICGYDSDRGTDVLLRFNVAPRTHFIQINAQYPLEFHPSETPLTIEYSHDTSGAVIDYASQVDADGWILNIQGKRQMWTPWANYELSCSCNPPQEGQTRYRTLDVKNPETRSVVLRYIIAFEQSEDVNQVQETLDTRNWTRRISSNREHSTSIFQRDFVQEHFDM